MNYNFEGLENFLAGTFHQDIEDPEIALTEYMDGVGREWLQNLACEIELFLTSELSVNDKEAFIIQHTEIYYPALEIGPLKWLVTVLETIKRYQANN